MIWIKARRGLYHLHIGGRYICRVRLDFDDSYQVDLSNDPPGDERCKNCMRSIDHMHYSAHVHKDRGTDDVLYRYGKHPVIFTRKLIIYKDFGHMERILTNIWIQQSGEVDDVPLRGAIAVYPARREGCIIDTQKPEIIRIKHGRYYKFE